MHQLEHRSAGLVQVQPPEVSGWNCRACVRTGVCALGQESYGRGTGICRKLKPQKKEPLGKRGRMMDTTHAPARALGVELEVCPVRNGKAGPFLCASGKSVLLLPLEEAPCR